MTETVCHECAGEGRQAETASGLCRLCWGTGEGRQDMFAVPSFLPAFRVRALSARLITVQAFEVAHGRDARDRLMRLYESDLQSFMLAVQTIEDGLGEQVAVALVEN